MSQLSKILLMLLIVAALGVVGYFVYLRFFPGAPVAQNNFVPVVPQNGDVVTSQKITLKQFSAKPVLQYWFNQKTNAVYYADADGKISKTFGDGRDEVVSDQTLADFHAAVASPDGARAIASFNYPRRETFALFDTNTNSWERLPEDVAAAAFDPGSQKVAYLRNSGSTSGLYIVTLGDRKTTQVLPLAVADGLLAWQTPNELYLFPKPTARVRSEVWLIDLAKKTVRLVDDNGGVMYQVLGSDVGLRLVMRSRAEFGLELTNGGGKPLNELPFLTLPSKCAAATGVLYCAVPESFPLRAELPDDYLKEKFFTNDSFVAYDVASGSTTLLPKLSAVVDAEQLMVQENTILFRNRIDEKVYSFEFREAPSTNNE